MKPGFLDFVDPATRRARLIGAFRAAESLARLGRRLAESEKKIKPRTYYMLAMKIIKHVFKAVELGGEEGRPS